MIQYFLKLLSAKNNIALPNNIEHIKNIFWKKTIAIEYFKTFAGSVKNFFGGEMRGFESLKTRARRDAILRIVEKRPISF
jgi:uncharacterized protein YbjQ (UPF0145 family)